MKNNEEYKKSFPKIIHGVEGHLSRKEAWFLLEIPSILKEGIYVDLGTYCGRSSILLADGIRTEGLIDSKVYTVDLFESIGISNRFLKGNTFSLAVENIKNKGLSHLIEICQEDSSKAADRFEDNSVAFIFIDANHKYDFVKKDFLSWYPKVRPGGIISFHDSTIPGVKKFLEESNLSLQVVDSISWTLKS